MHPQLQCEPTLYRSHQEILLRSEIVSCPRLRGQVEGMYPIWDQCRASLRGQEGSAEDPALRRWVYDLTVPVMVVGRDAAQRAEVHLSAALCTPFSRIIRHSVFAISPRPMVAETPTRVKAIAERSAETAARTGWRR